MKIAVFGMGAIGGYYGAWLARAGHDVTFIARGAAVDTIRKDGIHVKSLTADFHLPNVQVVDSGETPQPVDLLMLGLKAWQVEENLEAIKGWIGDSGVVLPLQNGIRVPYLLSERLGPTRVLGGLALVAAVREAPNRFVVNGPNHHIKLGAFEAPPIVDPQRVNDILNSAEGIESSNHDNIAAAMWSKFVSITSWGGAGCLSGLHIDQLLAHEETRWLLKAIGSEVMALAAAKGVPLPETTMDDTFDFWSHIPPGIPTSMQRDIAEGRPSELDDQHGVIVRMGKELGVATPISEAVYAAMAHKERAARKQG